ncbi:hypothetical protein ACFL0D_04170 [Thermoproteota archaeon]
MFGKRSGISTFIATLLLMVLAVSAGVVIYAYTMGYMGGFGGTDTLGAMSLDEGAMSDTQTDAYIRNIGKTTIVLDTSAQVYVDGVVSTFAVSGTTTPNEISESEVGLITISPGDVDGDGDVDASDVWSVGSTYEVKIIAADNTQITFNLKAQ